MKRSFKSTLEQKQRYKEKFEEQKQQKKTLGLFDTLNQEQFDSAMAKGRNNLVIASAGTGKTSTIIGRVSYLLNNGIKPNEIILLTFTSKAGKEMLQRLSKYFDKSIVEKIYAGTFHAYGKLLLDKLNLKRKLKKPKQMRMFFMSIYERKCFISKLDEDSYSSTVLFDYMNLYENTNEGESFKEWLENKFESKVDISKNEESKERAIKNLSTPVLDVYQEIYETYMKEKKEHRFCDFNDLLKAIPYYYSKPNHHVPKHIIVDEYQDVNNLQNNNLKFLEKKGSAIFAVGDYDQSIYAFNGSNVYLVKYFTKNFKNSTVYSLSKNYRSSNKICTIANNCIEKNERIIPKKLIAMKKGDFEEPKIIHKHTRVEQFEEVISRIQESKYELNEIAILFRGNNSGNIIEPYLLQNNIPTVRTKNSSFFDGDDIAVLISIFRILTSNGNILDFLSLSTVVENLTKDMCKTLFELKEKHEDIFKGMHEFKSTSFAQVVNQEHLNSLEQLMKDCVGVERPDMIFRLIYETPCYKFMVNNSVNKISKFSRVKNDNKEILSQIERKHRLLIDIAKGTENAKNFLLKTTFSSREEDGELGVNLMTVHASKGLEFKEVFIIDLVDGKFPNRKLAQEGGCIEEERRLFYVALTRAEEKLHLCYYDKDDKKYETKSPFIAECGLNLSEALQYN